MTSGENELIKKFMLFLKLEKGLAGHSIESYVADIKKLLAYLSSAGTDIRSAKPSDMQSFIAGLRDVGICARSQARILSGIKCFYRYLLLDGYAEEDPTVLLESPKLGIKLPEVLTVDEMNRLIGGVDLSVAEGQRNKASLEVMYGCGLRVSELVGLRVSQIYPEEEFIIVEGKGGKQRVVPISGSALREIRNYLPDRSRLTVKKGSEDILFLNRLGSKLTRVMIFYIIRKQCEVCGIRKKVSPHTLRHSFATHLLEGGANLRAIQEMLGHESIRTTEIYVHMDTDYIRTEILNHHPRNAG